MVSLSKRLFFVKIAVISLYDLVSFIKTVDIGKAFDSLHCGFSNSTFKKNVNFAKSLLAGIEY